LVQAALNTKIPSIKELLTLREKRKKSRVLEMPTEKVMLIIINSEMSNYGDELLGQQGPRLQPHIKDTP